MSIRRTLGTVIGTALVTCVVVLAGAWPRYLQADDAETQVAQEEDIGADTTKLGEILAHSRLVEDTAVKGKWYVEVKVQNTSGEAGGTVDIEESVQKATYTASMGRSGPIPTVAWKTHQKVEVGAKETKTVRQELPGWLGWQISASLKPPKLDKDGNPVVQSSTSFSTTVSKRG